MDRMEFWPEEKLSEDGHRNGYVLELQARIALRLVEGFGAIAAKVQGEDSAGRSILTLQSPQELVDRCFEIADLCVRECLVRGLVRKPTLTPEELAEAAGRLRSISLEKETARWRIRPEEAKL
jgi:hypothetical protein